jgi:hypothetical protein
MRKSENPPPSFLNDRDADLGQLSSSAYHDMHGRRVDGYQLTVQVSIKQRESYFTVAYAYNLPAVG